MTWNDQRKGWFGRTKPNAPEPIESVSVPLASEIPIPPFPSFSPASIAHLLKANRQTVYYWMKQGKLEFFRDNIGEPYILRSELLRFVRDYLKLPTLPQ